MNYALLEDEIVARLAPLVTAGHEVEVMPSVQSADTPVEYKGRVTVQVGMAKGDIENIQSQSSISEQFESVYVEVIVRSKRLRTDGGHAGVYALSELCRKLLQGWRSTQSWMPFVFVDFSPLSPENIVDGVFMYSLRMMTRTAVGATEDADLTPLITEITILPDMQIGPLHPTAELFASEYYVDNAGDQVVLAWISENGYSVTLSGVGTVSEMGSTTVTVDDDTTYTLTVTRGNEVVIAEVTVTVGLACAAATWSLVDTVTPTPNQLNSGSIISGGSGVIVAPNGGVKIYNSVGTILFESDVRSNQALTDTLSDVTHTQSDGSPEVLPMGVPVVCDAHPPCADVTQQVNGTTIGTTPSGGTNNQVIVNTAGTPQGTAANPSVIADTTIRNSATPTWTDSVVAGVTKTLAQGKALDSDGATTLLADYIPAADGFMFTCTPASYGTRILSVLKRQYCIEAEAAFSLRCLADEFITSPLIRARRSGDNAERDTLESEITDGTLTAWVISGGGTQEGFVVKYYDHTGNGYVLWVTTAGQQDRIVNAGVLVIDSGGKPAAEVMSSTANFRYTRRADGTTVPLGLVGGAGSMWLVAKRGVAALTYMLDRGGNPAIGVAMVNASTPSSGSGSPAYTVNSVALSPNTRTQLKTVTEGIETATIVNNISWASGNWYAGQSAVANQFPVGSLISECVIFNKDASVQQAYIQTNLDNYYAY